MFYFVLLFMVVLSSVTNAKPAEEVLVRFDKNFNSERMTASNAKVQVVPKSDTNILQVTTEHGDANSVILLKPQQKYWDVSRYPYLTVYIRNMGESTCKASWQVEDDKGGSIGIWANSFVYLEPGKERRLLIAINVEAGTDKKGNRIELSGMRSTPYGRLKKRDFDNTHVTQYRFVFSETQGNQKIEISPVFALGSTVWTTPNDAPIFPFTDRYGQYIHDDWPTKVRSAQDLAKQRDAETPDLKANPTPDGRDQYGGWLSGPALKATGHFRVQKYEGKWWFVDPIGKLFFSNGVACVSLGRLPTPITNRENYFQDIPSKEDKRFGQFYIQAKSQGHTLDCLNFVQANLFRKYGDSWQSISSELAQERIHSWGYNTLANWSDQDICFMKKTPYILFAGTQGAERLKRIQKGKSGFQDVFSPSFVSALKSSIRTLEGSENDPWCIGYFVDNELPWNDYNIAIDTLQSPETQPAKKAFMDMLKTKYGDIARLNKAWGTSHPSWDALQKSRKAPAVNSARKDFDDFLARFADHYFSVIAETLKAFAPNKLYLGCRFHSPVHRNRIMATAAARHCDVVSYNIYRYPEEMARFKFPAEMDVPLIIGEWHFGTLDRGMFDFGMCYVKDQTERADHYIRYMKQVLANPQFVGAHWFRYRDHPNTGRSSDDANASNGLLDVCDIPYTEIIGAARQVGHNLYRLRANGEWK